MSSVTAEPPAGAGGAATTGAGRIGNVDVLRAIAALAVLMIHAYALGGRSAPIKAQYWYDVPLNSLASGAVLFFAISGYVISRPFVDRLLMQRPLPDIRAYAIRRAFRIFPLYWIALTAVILIDGTGNARPWQLIVHYALLNNLVPGRQEALFSVAWTLTLEMLFYIAVPILALAVRQRWPLISAERLAALVLGSWLASILFTVVADLQGAGTIGLWLRGSLPAIWQLFCPGILLAVAPHLQREPFTRWLVVLPARRAAAVVGVGALLAASMLGATSPLRFGIVPYQLFVDADRPLYAIAYGLLLAAALRARPWGRPHGWALRLGLISYGIYLLHAVVADFLSRHPDLIPLRNPSLPAFAAHIALLAALTIALATASWQGLEQPAIGMARRLTRRREQQQRPFALNGRRRPRLAAHDDAQLLERSRQTGSVPPPRQPPAPPQPRP